MSNTKETGPSRLLRDAYFSHRGCVNLASRVERVSSNLSELNSHFVVDSRDGAHAANEADADVSDQTRVHCQSEGVSVKKPINYLFSVTFD